PVLPSIIEKDGFICELYDPYFFPELPDERKDFIFATECFEHFFEPAKEMQLITSLLIPQGVLSIMTQRWDEETAFSTWWYAQDKTHVLFFHNDTFKYICRQFNFSVLHDDGEKVIVLQKNVVREN
ncbi:MAG TPA: methyltransferase domain-containing protein, partial [Marinilabiliaceae bacterium]|nr:methyltransferase domain-containing protein [Marinilabiliaceae bacterium]